MSSQNRSFFAVLAATLVSMRSLACGAPETVAAEADDQWDEAESEIVGGVLVEPSQVPFVVKLTLDRGFAGSFTCTGTVINRDFVLTAAHCLTPEPERVVFNKVDGVPNSGFKASSWKVHRRFDMSRPIEGFDVAVLRMRGDHPDLPSLRLPNQPVAVGFRVTEFGFGDTKKGANDYETLRKRRVTVNDSGDRIFSTTGSGCNGDSGGPAMLNPGQGKPKVVVGIASTSDCRFQTSFTQVDHVLPFIRTAMSELQ